MGLGLSKAWKGLKKRVKKIARGVKKVFKKIGRAIGKLGIVGQIGMMFLMPYAMGALGSFFGTAGKLASWSKTLLGSSNVLAQGVGHGLNLINKAGTFVGNAYKSVTGTISEAFDRAGNFLKGRGFVKTPQIDMTKIQTSFEAGEAVSPDSLISKDIKFGDTDLNLFDKEGKLIFDTNQKNFFDMSADDFSRAMKTDPKTLSKLTNAVDTSALLERTKEKNLLSKALDDIKDFDVYETVKKEGMDAILKGGKQALVQKSAEVLGYDQPEGADFYSIDLPGMVSSYSADNAKFKEIDFTTTRLGNPYIASNMANSNYLNNILSEGNTAYDAYMANFAASQYSPMQRSLNPAMGF